ncbi:hypothetical protein RND71_018020 [Anisodus tanguticus]|uniref:Uncharacterized protein n=1 Tax=Anisodus tanguticus TaxID=243964 RepID=A0AAE1S4K7_9SOLA|nr:hypothetical protein RND71_018020 [Anisodus tanguticus]
MEDLQFADNENFNNGDDCEILKHVAIIYTRAIFTRFQHELLQGTSKKSTTLKKKTPTSSMAIRLNGLMKESFVVMTLAASDAESEEIVRKYLYQARVEVIKLQSELYVKDIHKSSLEKEKDTTKNIKS